MPKIVSDEDVERRLVHISIGRERVEIVQRLMIAVNRRLLEPIGNVPPAEAEANFYAALERSDMAA